MVDLYTISKIKELYQISNVQYKKIDEFIKHIKTYNSHTNIVGKSTLKTPWTSHVLDSIQISNFIHNKKKSVLDMGSGAGLPGIILYIFGYNHLSIIDSNQKKINFITKVCDHLNINPKISHQRIESLRAVKFDFIIARALAKLNKLFFYSYKLLKKDSTMIFLKGKSFANEILEAEKHWKFEYLVKNSMSDPRGIILIVKRLKKRI